MKWFDSGRGVGVIAQECAGPDAVAYRSAVHGDADSTLVVGERVLYDLTLDAAGVRADNIRPPLAIAVRRPRDLAVIWPRARQLGGSCSGMVHEAPRPAGLTPSQCQARPRACAVAVRPPSGGPPNG
ncbi:hypothetical protein AB0D27_28660 [Streptomyces sp. NPDC048415]|uniref:hypothetical protein n=1 Tax=Streptomyces sp. NPDC048415 TaxID=3154822 RepID=UPI003418DB78